MPFRHALAAVLLASLAGAGFAESTPQQMPPLVQSGVPRGQAPLPSSVGPRAMSLEVELVVLAKGPDGGPDRAGLARWSELAASGYRLSQVVHDGGHQYLYLERLPSGLPGQSVTLPAAVEQDAALATGVRTRIQATQAAQAAHLAQAAQAARMARQQIPSPGEGGQPNRVATPPPVAGPSVGK